MHWAVQMNEPCFNEGRIALTEFEVEDDKRISNTLRKMSHHREGHSPDLPKRKTIPKKQGDFDHP